MKNLYSSLLVLAFFALAFSCQESDNFYKGPAYVGFSDTLVTCPIYSDDREVDIVVAATTAEDYDRTFVVEVDDSISTAIEGVHYNLVSNTVVIEAGQTTGAVKIAGVHSSMESTDSIGVRLRLASRESFQWDLYPDSDRIDVVFAKVCDFDVNQFAGYILLTSSFTYEMSYYNWNSLVWADVDPDDEEGKTIIIRDWMSDGDIFRDNYDLRVSFNTDDPLYPELEMEDGQVIANSRKLFDYTYGDGWVRTDLNSNYFSFYNNCQGFAYLVHDVYVNDVGTVGTYYCIFEWISEGEAEYYLTYGF
ncbi:MAG: DUF4984 domain-containing protein [Rikenellaceae bacterium]